MKRLKYFAAAFGMTLMMAVPAFAGIEIEMDERPSFEKTITWYSDDGEAEYRYMQGEGTASDFDSATVAGSGSEASITVQEKGVYTLFAKIGDRVQAARVPVTTIDKTAPDIELTGVERMSDGSVDVTFEASDYFGVEEVRILSGSQPISSFDSAAYVEGNVLRGLMPGSYTLFAKDLAGNISNYPLTVDAWAESWESEEVESSEWATEWSSEWGSHWIEYDYEIPDIVLISKADMVTGEEIPGAHLQITDAGGNLVMEWETDGTQTRLENKLTPGNRYTLTEITAPDGYEIAESVEFTVKEDGSVTHVIMYDKPIKETQPDKEDEVDPGSDDDDGPAYEYEPERGVEVLISKADMVNGEEIPGAHLQITDKNGVLVMEWVTDGTQTRISNMLSPGETYTLTEITAPDGYEIAESIEFTVNTDGSVTKVIMYDKRKEEPAPQPSVEKFPQTGGILEGRSLGVVGIANLLAFAIIMYLFSRKK